MTREQIIEAMARAICEAAVGPNRGHNIWSANSDYERRLDLDCAKIALSAIEALGYVVVRKEAGDNDLKAMRKAAPKYWKDSHGSDEWLLAVRHAMIEAGKV